MFSCRMTARSSLRRRGYLRRSSGLLMYTPDHLSQLGPMIVTATTFWEAGPEAHARAGTGRVPRSNYVSDPTGSVPLAAGAAGAVTPSPQHGHRQTAQAVEQLQFYA